MKYIVNGLKTLFYSIDYENRVEAVRTAAIADFMCGRLSDSFTAIDLRECGCIAAESTEKFRANLWSAVFSDTSDSGRERDSFVRSAEEALNRIILVLLNKGE